MNMGGHPWTKGMCLLCDLQDEVGNGHKVSTQLARCRLALCSSEPQLGNPRPLRCEDAPPAPHRARI